MLFVSLLALAFSENTYDDATGAAFIDTVGEGGVLTRDILNVLVKGVDANQNYMNIKALEIGDNVASLEESLFYEADRETNEHPALESLTLKNKVSVGKEAFKDCNRLATITTPSFSNIGNYAFENCAFETLEIGSLDEMGKGAFKSCSNLKYVDFPENIISLPELTFDSCEKFEFNTFIEKNPNITIFGSRSFGGLKNDEVTISVEIKEIADSFADSQIGNLTFDLKLQHVNGENSCFDNATITTLNLNIKKGADFENNQKKFISFFKDATITTVNLCIDKDFGDISFGDVCFFKDYDFNNLNFNQDDPSIKRYLFKYLKVKKFKWNVNGFPIGAFSTAEKIESLEFGEGVSFTKIGKDAFSDIKNISGITLPVSVESFEFESFQRSNFYGDFDLSNNKNLKTFWNGCFQLSKFYGEFMFPSNLEELNKPYIFNLCEFIGGKIDLGNSLKILGNFVFTSDNYNSAFTKYKIIFPETLQSIGKNCFQNSSIQTLDLSNCNELTEIGMYCFQTKALEKAILPYSLTTLGEGTFYESGLQSVEFKSSIQSSEPVVYHIDNIPVKAFFKNENLSTFEFPTSITSFGSHAFYEAGLTIVDLSQCNQLLSIGTNSFQNTVKLSTVKLPSSLQFIYGNAFQNSKLDSIIFGNDSQMETICQSAFQESGLKSIDFGEKSQLKSIESNAFYKTNLINIDLSKCANLKSIDKYCFQETKYLSEAKLPSALSNLGEGAFYSSSLISINFGEDSKLTSIQSKTFCSTKLKSITLPTGITSIGENAFNGAPITEIDLSQCASLSSIGNYAFRQANHEMKSAILPSSLSTMGEGAFSGTSLEDGISLNGCQLNSIPAMAFSNTNFTSFDFQSLNKTLQVINEKAFEGSSLQKVNFSGCSDLRTIGKSAFQNSNSLISVELSYKVERLEEQCFYGCKLNEFIIPSGNYLQVIEKDFISGNINFNKLVIPNGVSSKIEFVPDDEDGHILKDLPENFVIVLPDSAKNDTSLKNKFKSSSGNNVNVKYISDTDDDDGLKPGIIVVIVVVCVIVVAIIVVVSIIIMKKKKPSNEDESKESVSI